MDLRFDRQEKTAGDLSLGAKGGGSPGGSGGDAIGEDEDRGDARRNDLDRPDDDDRRRRGRDHARGLHLAGGAGAVGLAAMGENVESGGSKEENSDERRHPAFHAVTLTKNARVPQMDRDG